MQHKCTCGDPNCKQVMHLSHQDWSNTAELSIEGANGHTLLYLDKDTLVGLALDTIGKAYQVGDLARAKRDRMWKLLQDMNDWLDRPWDERGFAEEDELTTELQALLSLHKKGEI